MNRIIALLAALTLSACQSDRKPSIASGPTLIQGFDADGRATMTSYAGRTSAGAGMLNDTSEADIIKALAEKIEPGTPFAYSHIVKSDIVQPNVESVSKLESDHKEALAAVAKAAVGGATGDLSKAEDLAKIAGKRLADRINADKAGPKPDSGANSARLLAVGVDSGLTTVAAVSSYKEGHNAKTRASYESSTDTKTKDISTPADMLAYVEALKARHAAIDSGRTNAPPAAPVAPPVVFPPLDPDPVVTPPASTNATETIVLPELPK